MSSCADSTADFVQPPPVLGNQYREDRVLRSHLHRVLPEAVIEACTGEYDELGADAARAWSDARLRTPEQPRLVQWDAWGTRIDRIETTTAWRRGAAMTARYGFVAAGHDARHGAHARIDQFVRAYLYHVASEFHTCPLAMSDGAATALKASGNTMLCDRVLPRLLARDPAKLWISGQWMTETAGGSDVGNTGTLARRDASGQWRLHGRKWFTSAVVGEMALTLARPEGAPAGADALALFLVETRDAHGGSAPYSALAPSSRTRSSTSSSSAAAWQVGAARNSSPPCSANSVASPSLASRIPRTKTTSDARTFRRRTQRPGPSNGGTLTGADSDTDLRDRRVSATVGRRWR
jgi:hypothetical protein